MDGNQNSNPLDYSQSGVVYKDLNGNGTAASNIKSNEFVDQNGIKSPSAPLGQVKFVFLVSRFSGSSSPFDSVPKNPKAHILYQPKKTWMKIISVMVCCLLLFSIHKC